MAFSIEERRERDKLRKREKYYTRRDTILKNRYGIREFDYEQLAKAQNNKCAICGITPENKRLDLDHCHETKEIRGLLCNNCNRGLGHFKDNIDLLSKAKTYLINSQQAKIPVVYGATSQAMEVLVGCKDDPLAPHGFNRNLSHTLGRYVCDCEFWAAFDPVEPVVIDDNREPVVVDDNNCL